MKTLFPVSYSKRRTVKLIISALNKAPKQLPNSKEAWNGYVVEFKTSDNPLVGTLTEIHKDEQQKEYRIVADDGYIDIKVIDDSFIWYKVERKING